MAMSQAELQKRYHGTPLYKKLRAIRNAARRKAVKLGLVKKGDGKEVDHKTPLIKQKNPSIETSNQPGKTRVVDRFTNRHKKDNAE